MSQLRGTARSSFLVIFAVAVLAGLAVTKLLSKRRALPGLLVAATLLEYFPVGLGFRHPVQRDRKVLVELPDCSGSKVWGRESVYMCLLDAALDNLVNGYIRFYPSQYSEDFAKYRLFPAKDAVRHMEQRDIDFVIVYLSEYRVAEGDRLRKHPSLLECSVTTVSSRLAERLGYRSTICPPDQEALETTARLIRQICG